MQALEVAEDIAKRYGSELVLFHVAPLIPRLEGHAAIFTEGEYENQLIASAKQRLADMVAKLQQAGMGGCAQHGQPEQRSRDGNHPRGGKRKGGSHGYSCARSHRLASPGLRLGHRPTGAHSGMFGAGSRQPSCRSSRIRSGVRKPFRSDTRTLRSPDFPPHRLRDRLAHPAVHRVQHF
jgi:hypothetical protein